MMRRQVLFLLFIGIFFLGACGEQESTPTPAPVITALPVATVPLPAAVAVEPDVVYATPLESGPATQRLDVYRPVSGSGWSTAILLHGSGQGKRDLAEWAEPIAAQGVTVFAVGWPVPPSSPQPHRLREAQEAVLCAVRFARARAAAHGADPDAPLILAGFSAGAVSGLSAALGQEMLLSAWDGMAESAGAPPQYECAAPEGTARVDAFVGVGGPYDAMATPADLMPVFNLDTLLERGDRALQIHLVHGTADTRVSESHSQGCLAAAEAAGYNVTLSLVDGGGHTILSETTVPLIVDLAWGGTGP